MRDMTKGSAFEHLWKYALPLILGNWFQLGYNAVDSMIAGRFIGKDALAAVGIAAPVMNLVILSITGLCLGAGVLMSNFFGAKDFASLRAQFSTTLLSGMALSLLVTLLGMIFALPIMKALSVPASILDITLTYVRITFLGAPFTFLYNALAAALKSIGDSKTPLKFLMFASILNGILDIIFIGFLGFGIVCSATTTVVAEAVSALLAGIYLIKNIPQLRPHKKEWRIDKSLLVQTVKYGGVTALQQSVQPIGKLLIQGQVNALGVDVIAAFNAVTKVDAFAFVPQQSIAQAITTYIAQNRGAKQEKRIRHGFAVGMVMETCYWIFIGCLTMLFKKPIMSLFVTGETANNIIGIGAHYLALMAWFYLLPAMTNGVQGFFRGIGKLKLTLLGTSIQVSGRVIFTFILAPHLGIAGIAYACVIGWVCMLLVQVPICLYDLHRLNRRSN
ncbi:MAG: MATE family efflux transporter [Lachnospiraceae bacterium]|nr:MATE family efflux transporter [Lachnospiraceae bacterium]